MHRNTEEEMKQIQKKLRILLIIDGFAMILIGLGSAGVFSADGNAIFALLNNKNIAYGAIIVGGVVAAWCLVKIFSLRQRQVELQNEEDT